MILILIIQCIIVINSSQLTTTGGGITMDTSQRNQNAIVSLRKSESRISSSSSSYESYDIISPFGDIEAGGSEMNLTSIDSNKLGTNIQAVFSTENAFLALRSDNTIYTWGHKLYSGIIPHESEELL